jgi:hypothetical protein
VPEFDYLITASFPDSADMPLSGKTVKTLQGKSVLRKPLFNFAPLRMEGAAQDHLARKLLDRRDIRFRRVSSAQSQVISRGTDEIANGIVTQLHRIG